ncbi:hypothetical protein SAY86_005136 [Trapa natans]|uniref:Iron-sulfur cluster biosynthesis family protein n=1 Tax=Trapa natans TaxID=22666 RepID=A0AAN7QV97_TRANT|nr:hypothetical protein SAY86_005136 [Trapa natans]
MASLSTCFIFPCNSRFFSSSISLRSPSHFHRVGRPESHFHFSGISRKLLHGRANFLLPVPRASIDMIRPGGAVETDRLPTDVRKRAMEAVDTCGGRVTYGDVASRAGLKLNEAQRALQALAADTGGFLEVSDEGDVLYVFPKDYRAKLAAKSFRIKFEPWFEKAKGAAEYVVRVSFGTALIASIVLVYTTIIAIISSRSEEDNRGRRGGRSYYSGLPLYFSPTDLFWYWDPYYYKRRRVQAEGGSTNFIESRTASSQRSGRKEYVGRRWADFVGSIEKFFKEKKWQFSKTGTSERAMVIGLGGLNLLGVIILGAMLK